MRIRTALCSVEVCVNFQCLYLYVPIKEKSASTSAMKAIRDAVGTMIAPIKCCPVQPLQTERVPVT